MEQIIDKENKLKGITASHSRIIYILCCVFFCGLYFVRDILDVNVSFYLIYLVAAATVMIVSKEEAIAFLISISAFSNAGFNGVFCTLMLIVVFLRFFRNSYNLMFIFVAIMCLAEGIRYLTPASSVAFGEILTYVAMLLCLLFISQYPHEKIDRRFVLNSFIAFSLFFAVMSVLLLSKTTSFDFLIKGGFRSETYTELTVHSSHLLGNQNFLTSLCSVNIALCLLLFNYSKRRWHYILFIMFFVFVGLLTISKMFLLVLVFLAVYIIYVAAKKNIFYGLGLAACLIGVAAILILLFGDTLIALIIERFNEGDLTTGRTEIIDKLLAYMEEHPWSYIIGVGLLDLQNVLGQAVHSSVFEVLGGWGVLGMAFCVLYIAYNVKQAKLNRALEDYSISYLHYLPLIMMLIYSLIGMLFSSAFAIIKLSVCFYALELKGETKNAL